MDKNIQKAATAVLVAATIILWGTMIGLTGALDVDWLKASNAMNAAGFILSPFMFGFLVFFPLTFGLVSALTHKFEKLDLYIGAIPGAIFGILVFLVMFGWDIKTVVFGAITLPAMAVVIEASYFRKDELKKMVAFRTAGEAAKKGFLVFIVGIFLVYAFVGSANNEVYVKDFFDMINSKVTGQILNGTTLADAAAEQQLNIQKIAYVQILNSPNFKKLADKTDPDVAAFVESTEQSAQVLDDPKTKQAVIRQIKDSGLLEKTTIDAEFFKDKFPQAKPLFDFYWLFGLLGLITVFTLYTNLAGGLLAAIYASAIKYLLDLSKTVPQSTEKKDDSIKEKFLSMK